MDNMEKVCDEKHKGIDMRLDAHDRRLDKHGEEIDSLQKSDVKNSTQIDNLTNAIGSQTKAIWGLVSTVLVTLIGFFVWYIQTLG